MADATFTEPPAPGHSVPCPADEVTAPFQVSLAPIGKIALDQPVRLRMTILPKEDLPELKRMEAKIALPSGVKRVQGNWRRTWLGPMKKGSIRTLEVSVVVSQEVASAGAPFISATAAGQMKSGRFTDTAALYPVVLQKRLLLLESLSIAIRQSLHGSLRMAEPQELLIEATSPVTLPQTEFTIGLPEGVALVQGSLSGQVALLEGRTLKKGVTIRVEKAGTWTIGSFFEGTTGDYVFRGSGELTIRASADGALTVVGRSHPAP